MVQHKLHELELDTVRTWTTYLYFVLWTYNKLIKDRKLLLLFPQFIKYKTFELLWNLDITLVLTYCPFFNILINSTVEKWRILWTVIRTLTAVMPSKITWSDWHWRLWISTTTTTNANEVWMLSESLLSAITAHVNVFRTIINSGGSKRGARDARPLWAKISLFSCSFQEKLVNSILAAPLWAWRPLLWEILDPKLINDK